MTPELGDLHAGEPGHLGARFALETTKGFLALGVRFVVIGGWAVRALGSPLPSIDLDCLIHADEWWRHEVHDFIDERTHIHRTAHADSYLEVDGLEYPNAFWNNPAAYTPIDLFNMTGTDHVQLTLLGETINWEIPSLEGLFLMKLKAARDRGQQLRAVLDPVLLSRLPDDARYPFEGIPDAATFLRRKVEKDIGDLAFLKSLGVSLTTVAETAARLAILDPLLNFTMQVPEQAFQGASRLLARHDIHIDPAPLISETKDAFELARRGPIE